MKSTQRQNSDAEHARKEAPASPAKLSVVVSITSLALAVRRIRCELEGGGQ